MSKPEKPKTQDQETKERKAPYSPSEVEANALKAMLGTSLSFGDPKSPKAKTKILPGDE